MQALWPYLHSYALCLLKPRQMLDWLAHGIRPYGDEGELERPDLVSQVALSWAMALVQGFARLLMANVLVQLFLAYHNHNDLFSFFIDVQDGLFPYYFLVLSTALDLVFFPILTLVQTQVWAFVLRLYARALHLPGDEGDIAEQVTNVALSSHFFLLVPIIGPVFQQLSWLYLLYVGCRHRLGASRSLSIVILLTPTVVTLMLVSLVIFGVFCLT
mgnify:CR=1 FL=1